MTRDLLDWKLAVNGRSVRVLPFAHFRAGNLPDDHHPRTEYAIVISIVVRTVFLLAISLRRSSYPDPAASGVIGNRSGRLSGAKGPLLRSDLLFGLC